MKKKTRTGIPLRQLTHRNASSHHVEGTPLTHARAPFRATRLQHTNRRRTRFRADAWSSPLSSPSLPSTASPPHANRLQGRKLKVREVNVGEGQIRKSWVTILSSSSFKSHTLIRSCVWAPPLTTNIILFPVRDPFQISKQSLLFLQVISSHYHYTVRNVIIIAMFRNNVKLFSEALLWLFSNTSK